jgi:hypothetical protein
MRRPRRCHCPAVWPTYLGFEKSNDGHFPLVRNHAPLTRSEKQHIDVIIRVHMILSVVSASFSSSKYDMH